MNRHVALPVAAVLVVLTNWAPSARSAEPLNIVLICADDLNTNLGCYGHAMVQSPQIDRLAARGMRFDRAYCQYPVCNASRTSFLTGRYPRTTRVIDNATPPRTHLPDVVFLPQHFRQNGYQTLKVGKIFHTGDAFEDSASWDVDIREDRRAKNPPEQQIARQRGEHGIVLECEEADTWDGFVARRAVELLNSAAEANRPFFLAVGFRRPHSPYIAPVKYHKLYPSSAIPPLDEPSDHLAGIPPVALTYSLGAKRMSPADRPDVVGAYYASITFMDAQLGLVLDALDRRQIWKNTVVLFLSDHGYHLGEHGGLWHKMSLFEASARVPLVICVPGRGASTAGQLVELVDLYPTLCELCRLSPPAGLEGVSLAALLNGQDAPVKQAAYSVVSRSSANPGGHLDPNKMGRSVRTDRWRFTAWFDGGRELYDYQTDPHEYKNLASSSDHAPIVEQHLRILEKLDPHGTGEQH